MTTLAPQRLHRVLAYIEDHVNERVAVQQLAATVHMSPFHFTRVFKVAVGHSPHAYLTRVRMERARELLATTQLPIVKVARHVGFQTQAHFTCVFRKHTGVTPRAYRVMQIRPVTPPPATTEHVTQPMPQESPSALHVSAG